MKWMKLLISSMAAGLMVGVGGTVFLSAQDKVVGGVLFSIGLLTICIYGFRLFTGSIGYLLTDRTSSWGGRMGTAAVIWAGNFIATTVYGSLIHLAKPELAARAAAMCDIKLGQSLPYNLFMGILCGMLMFLAVDVYKRHSDFGRFVGILFAVPVFILAGFEHSIADMLYFAIGRGQLLPPVGVWVFLLTVTLGNCVGALIIPCAAKAVEKG